jgi:hypothetical protein
MTRTLLLVALVAATPTQLFAQDRWENQVRHQIRSMTPVADTYGYEMSHDVYTGRLYDGGREDVRVNLRAGQAYVITAVCDADCSDLDLKLFDQYGDEVDRDLRSDDTPIVQAAPSRTGEYTLRVLMPSCSAGPCRYGVAVYSR